MKSSYIAGDTIAAIATPPGDGALGIVRLSGEKSVGIVSSLVSLAGGAGIESLPDRKCALGVFRRNGQRVDRVMVAVFRAPHSFTGENLVEITCHGGRVVLKLVMDLVVASGARVAEPGEFSQRAYLNGKLDLAQAEAICDLIQARTEASSRIAFSHVEGGISREVGRLRDALIGMMASLEVAIDHTDDPTVGTALTLNEIDLKIEMEIKNLQNLVRSYDFGRLIKEGIKIAIVGKPNVGKSSLLNCLLKSERAIVTPYPGTTRDTIEEGFDLLGIPAVLVDTAGLRSHTLDPVEQIGIERTKDALEKADAVIAVIDGSIPLSSEDEQVARLTRGKRGVLAVGKCDLPGQAELSRAGKMFSGYPLVPVSPLRQKGVQELLESLSRQVIGCDEGGLNERKTVVSSLRQKNCLARAQANLLKARDLIRGNGMEECVALELREALDELGEIVGEVASEDILQEVFSKFCIGK